MTKQTCGDKNPELLAGPSRENPSASKPAMAGGVERWVQERVWNKTEGGDRAISGVRHISVLFHTKIRKY